MLSNKNILQATCTIFSSSHIKNFLNVKLFLMYFIKPHIQNYYFSM